MALVYNRETIGVKAIGRPVSVPNNPKARLMYYLNCMCIVLSLDQTGYNIRRLTQYNNYTSLTEDETAALVLLCTLLDPITLNGVCIFNDDEACGGSDNKFYEINSRQTTFAAADTVLVGGIRVSVKKVMCFKMNWLKKNYVTPLTQLLESRNSDRIATYGAIQNENYRSVSRNTDCNWCCCTIL